MNKKFSWIFIVQVFWVLFLCGCQKKEEIVFVDASMNEEVGTVDAVVEEEMNPIIAESIETQTNLPVTKIFVHVCGAVKNPGVYELVADSRVIDAVEAAGGVLENSALDAVNLASTISDGEKIWIPTYEEAEEMELAKKVLPDTQIAEDRNKININTADSTLLCSLPGIGETRAQSIIAYREEYGAFESIEEIMKVNGIKENSFQKIKDFIVVQ